MKRKLTCSKCKSTAINITWKYSKNNEIAMLLSHDGYGLQFEDAIIKCAKCGSYKLLCLEESK